MKGLAILLILLATHSTLGICQSKLGNEWITGGGGQKIRFNTSSITTNNSIFYNTYFVSGNSNICDTSGNLILCSDGYNIYDSNANYLEDGDSLVYNSLYVHYNGWSIYSQTSIFLPMDSNKYYFVTPCYSDGNLCFSCPFDVLLYNVIDMSANGGAGKVTKRMQPLMQDAKLSRTQMMACRHSNGKDWWLLKQGHDSNIVYKFLFTQDSIYDFGKQVFTSPMWGAWDLEGQSTFSKDGDKYANVSEGNNDGDVFVAEFDRCYGLLSVPQILTAPIFSGHDPSDTTLLDKRKVGISFSPNGRFIYVVFAYNILQYDLEDQTWFHVAGLDTTFLQFQNYGASYLGPDDKLYIGNFAGQSHQMSVIDNPDIKGAGCNFCPRCLRMDTLVNGYAGTPPCMPNYSLGAQECWPLSTHEVKDKRKEIKAYPNPASNQLTIQFPEGTTKATIILYNILGEAVLTQTNNTIQQSKTELQLGHLANGVYSIHAWVGDTPYISKVVKE